MSRTANLLGALSLMAADRVREATGAEPTWSAALVTLQTMTDGGSIDQLRRVLGLSHSGGVRVVKSFAREDRQLERFRGRVGRVFDQAMVTTRLQAFYNPFIGFLPQAGLAAILFYRLRGKKLTGAMITGRSALEPGVEPMRPAAWWKALLCLLAAIAIARWIVAGAPPFGR